MTGKKHTVEQVKHNLDLNEQISLHEKGWIIQRIGWVVLWILVLLGGFGFFGEGLLSKRTATDGQVKVDYERYFRYEAEMKVVVESDKEHIGSVSLPQAYLKNFRIVRFVPEPEGNHTNNEDVIYQFRQGMNRFVSIYVIPKEYGVIKGDIKVNGTHSLALHHYIYP